MGTDKLTIKELSALLKKREVSSREITLLCLENIAKSKLNAFNYTDKEQALNAADRADKLLGGQGEVSPLTGIPVAVKDNICVEGMPVTCSSKMLKNYMPPYSAVVAEKLKASGAVIIGKANMDEFAMGCSNETSAFGNVLNPVDNTRVPGGSSGGSAAAVGGCLAYGALGSDTGGSIRQPSAFCGVVGLKPTYGVVSRNGLIAFGSSLDQIGPITRCVYDNAIMLSCISGYDNMDSTSQNIDYPDYAEGLNGDVKGLKIGVPKEYFGSELKPEVKSAVLKALKVYTDNGAEIIDISLPYTDAGLAVYHILSSAEAASNLARYDGIKYGYRAENFADLTELYINSRTEGFGAEVKRRIMLGNFVLSSKNYDMYYLKALKLRTLIKQSFESAFNKCDLIMGPSAPCTAFKFGEKGGNPLSTNFSDLYNVMVNLAGLPAISLPCGKYSSGLPAGLQIIGRPFSEKQILKTAQFFETAEGYKWNTK